MIKKGTEDYKKAQKLANELVEIANYERWNDNTMFNIMFNPFALFLDKIIETDTFASKIAKTVSDKMNPYGYKIANVSQKQAWILACCAIENDIKQEYINE